MESVFKRLIRFEFGEKSYYKFFLLCKMYFENKYLKSEDNQNIDSWLLPIYIDIFEQVKEKEPDAVNKMRDRLKEALELGIRIKRNFIYAFLFFLGAVLLIFMQGFPIIITWVSITAMVICFLFKVYEYVINKYCLIDLQIIMVYKLVLDTVSSLEEIKKNNR
jgi:hypothetical protein